MEAKQVSFTRIIGFSPLLTFKQYQKIKKCK